jgi:hypothetical protein
MIVTVGHAVYRVLVHIWEEREFKEFAGSDFIIYNKLNQEFSLTN